MSAQAERIYSILREVVAKVSLENGSPASLPATPDMGKTLQDQGIGLEMMPDIQDELTVRFKGRKVNLGPFLSPMEFDFLTMDRFLNHLQDSLGAGPAKPVVVYVDDEEENTFVFNRKFGKRLNLKVFSKPEEALQFVRSNSDVALVITDEVMPILNGNTLCDKVQETNPQIPFVLITGNPNQDEDLMYRSLRHGRFYEFIQKPLDLDKKGEEYFELFTKLIAKRAAV